MSDLGNKEVFARNLAYYMTKFDVDRNKICSDLEIPYTTLADWLNAKKYPRIDKIEMLSIYFDINKSDLIEDRDIQDKPLDELDILFSKHKDILTDEDKEYMRFIIEKRKREIDKQRGEVE